MICQNSAGTRQCSEKSKVSEKPLRLGKTANSEEGQKKKGVRFKNLAGMKVGRLTVLATDGKDSKGGYLWRCRCSCGNVTTVASSCLVCATTRSCGCLRAENKQRLTHGQSYTPEHRSWTGMKGRCYNLHNHAFENYGGRGITVCDRWLNSFENFLADMGKKPPGFTLDRINNNGNYEPSNCRWATARQQANNRRSNRLMTFQGRTQTCADWAMETGISAKRIHHRLALGWSFRDVISIPVSPFASIRPSPIATP